MAGESLVVCFWRKSLHDLLAEYLRPTYNLFARETGFFGGNGVLRWRSPKRRGIVARWR